MRNLRLLLNEGSTGMSTVLPQIVTGILALLISTNSVPAQNAPPGTARVDFFGYRDCVRVSNGNTSVTLGHQAGGRVLEYSLNGVNAIYLDPRAAGTAANDSGQGMTGGRFDVGPEQTIARHPLLWSGAYDVEITGPRSARMTSRPDPATGLQVVRDFALDADSPRLTCVQTMRNISDRTVEACYWCRTFAEGRGIAVVPVTTPSKYPHAYVMYEGRDLIQMRPQDEKIQRLDDYLVITGPPKFPKLGMDSTAGWFAYLTPQDLLFVKQFPVFPDRVYNEVAGLTMSIWYPDGPMVELEPIGPREILRPGESASFTEVWTLWKHPFPQGTSVDPQSIEAAVKTLPPIEGAKP